MSDNVVMRSTRGVRQEFEFSLVAQCDGCSAKSEVRIDGLLPHSGPCLLTPVSPDVARRWLDNQTAKLRRNAAQFQRMPSQAEIEQAVGTTVSVLDNPTILLEALIYRALAGQFAPKK